MNDRMEHEIERTIQTLQASMPKTKKLQTSMLTLLRVAFSEMNIFLLLGLFIGALVVALSSIKLLYMPMLTVFCITPMPMLLLLHRYVLAGNDGMCELEETLYYSYAEMLSARFTVVSFYMLGILVFLSMTLHFSFGENFLRLALCGAVPSIYLCVILLSLSMVIRNQESISMIVIALWAALCFLAILLPVNQFLMLCSTASFATLAVVGVILYGVCMRAVQTRRFFICGLYKLK